MRQQQRREQPDGLILGLCAGIAGVWITECISKRVTEPVFFTIVEQSAAVPDVLTGIISSRPACWLLSAQHEGTCCGHMGSILDAEMPDRVIWPTQVVCSGRAWARTFS